MGSEMGIDTEEDLQVDPNVLEKLPHKNVLGMTYHGASAWAKTYQIDTETPDRELKSYFLKVSVGYHGREALMGEFESTSAIYAIVPEYTNNPIAWGAFREVPDTYFYLCVFRNFSQDLPEPLDFCAKLALLHQKSASPNGKFGFHVVTYNGDLPQENGYTDTWEECFINGLKHMIKLNKERAGESELQALEVPMCEKVIPRLLRPLESHGRSVKPSLVHGDLWFGNTAMDIEIDKPIVFDPCCFYAHNEYELGNWRQERNKFSRSYFNAYHTHIAKAYPEEDYDDRNALYTIRFNLHAATLFPQVPSFRESVIEEMERLIAKHPNGFADYVEK